jgi:DNA (cytosine-5)-methyltransferase 1
MTHGSLFSGIGGFDLAAEWMGWENIFHCEWNEFGQKVLKYHFPNAITYHDITKTDFTIHRGAIDILTGGFPCQPYSMAGKRLGKEDERHLWPEMLRAIREIQPRWVVGENVLGLVNWSGGLVFHEVQADLEAEGYEVQPYVLPAVSVNAPHRRDRIWFIAHSKSNGWNGRECKQRKGIETNQWEFCEHTTKGWDEIRSQSKRHSKGQSFTNPNSNGFNQRNGNDEEQPGEGRLDAQRNPLPSNGNGDVADTSCRGVSGYGRESQRKQIQTAEFNKDNSKQFRRMDWEKFPTQSPVCNGDDGLSSKLDGITFSKWRNESIKAGGNAIVPQVAHQIFKAIQQYENGQFNK